MNPGFAQTPWEGLVILASVSILFFLVVLVSSWKRVGIGKDMTKGFIIGGAQLALVSIILMALIEWEGEGTIWLPAAAVMVTGMAIISAARSAKRSPDMPFAFRTTAASISLGSVLSLSVLLVADAIPLRPEFVIPLAGMAFGNSMDICSLTMDRMTREFQTGRGMIETRLSLGATSSQAVEDIDRMAIRTALIPTIDRMKTLGIIFIPGAMAGLIMAGVQPLVAAQFQLVIFLMIVGGGVITSLATVTLARESFFNENHQLQDWV